MTFVSYAQNFEDVLLWRALKHVAAGFYIDVGAADPREGSVTQAFYERGWRGINIEPEAFFAERLRTQRPLDLNIQMAAGAKPGKATFHRIAGTGLSTLSGEIAELHSGSDYPQSENVDVDITTVFDLWTSNGSPDVHFLKIDVEGSERSVLEGCRLDVFRPWIVVIEATKPLSSELVREEFEDLLLGHRYERCWFDGLNDWYIPQERTKELIQHFQSPPNPFDNFVMSSLVDEIERRKGFQADAESIFAIHGRAQERIKELETAFHMLETSLNEANQRMTALYETHKADQKRIAELELAYSAR
ncbi:MAG: FkbM family methyltransferase [Hyphomicrobiales bacterium]|nr:MAG: FkbM family methyltransferase [Hyphomicrobiales bacterium]